MNAVLVIVALVSTTYGPLEYRTAEIEVPTMERCLEMHARALSKNSSILVLSAECRQAD